MCTTAIYSASAPSSTTPASGTVVKDPTAQNPFSNLFPQRVRNAGLESSLRMPQPNLGSIILSPGAQLTGR